MDHKKLFDDAGRTIKPVPEWLFGQPSLVSSNNGKVRWDKGSTSPLDQKGATGWLAALYGGVQTGDDWARVNIPVNELNVPEFESALWSYYMTNTEVYGINIVIWVHDPTDFDKRAEITQTPAFSTIEKSAGWNAHELDIAAASQFFYYGEGTSSGLTAGTAYSWNQFRADSCFKDWTIYRITLESGWYSTGTFEDIWVADISLNGNIIPLYPDTSTYSRVVNVQKTLEAEGTYTANDVMSESDTNGLGTAWIFDMGGTGKITQAVVTTPTTRTSAIALEIYGNLPTCELDDNAAYNGPLVADLPFYMGRITLAAMTTIGGPSSTQSTLTNQIPFDSPKLYVVAIDLTGQDFGDDTTLNIILSARMDIG